MKKIIIIGSMFISSIASIVFADTHYVSTNGTDIVPFNTLESGAWNIQSAINIADDGDTVLVDEGTYIPNVPITIDKNIIVKSIKGAGKTIIDGNSSPMFSLVVIQGGCSSTFDGFTIQNGGMGGVYVSLSPATVKNCVIHHNKQWGFYDFGGCKASNLTIAYNQVYGYYAYKVGNLVYSAVNFIMWGNGTDVYIDGMGDRNGPEPVWCVTDPSFYSTNDFRLRPESICINAGDTHDWMTNDIAAGGNHRVIDGACDLGAYEYTPPPQMQGIHQAIEINWASTLGVDYQVQYTTNLTSNVWIDLIMIAGNGGTCVAFDSTKTTSSKIYRVVAK